MLQYFLTPAGSKGNWLMINLKFTVRRQKSQAHFISADLFETLHG
jgi:hypothetical protein